jgi:hypothetical protein
MRYWQPKRVINSSIPPAPSEEIALEEVEQTLLNYDMSVLLSENSDKATHPSKPNGGQREGRIQDNREVDVLLHM